MKQLRTLIFGLVMAAAVSASALTIELNGNNFETFGVGSWSPASDLNNPKDVTDGAKILIDWYNGGAAPLIPGMVFVQASSSLTTPLPSATYGEKWDNGTPATIDPHVYSYVYGKYGNVGYLFYIGGQTDDFKLATSMGGTFGNNGLSHQVAFTGGPTVPDGGVTLALLGFGLAATGVTRRFMKK